MQLVCRTEATSSPCPQLMLMACTTIVAGGRGVPQIFKVNVRREEVEYLYSYLSGSHLCCIPPATSPHTVACMLKLMLENLPEPLMTFRLLEDWLVAANSLNDCKRLLQVNGTGNADAADDMVVIAAVRCTLLLCPALRLNAKQASFSCNVKALASFNKIDYNYACTCLNSG